MSEEIQCPHWCTRTHGALLRFLHHTTTLADAQLYDLDVTVKLTLAEILGDPVAIGPFARICFETRGTRLHIKLDRPQVQMLAHTLNHAGGATMMADALTRAGSALERAAAHEWSKQANSLANRK